jgi:hypothetical protein
MTKDDTERWLAGLEHADVQTSDARDLREIGLALVGIDAAEAALRAAVERARAAGRSWTEIANVLGVSRQAARQRFNEPHASSADVSHVTKEAKYLVDVNTLLSLQDNLARVAGHEFFLASKGDFAKWLAHTRVVKRGTTTGDIEELVGQWQKEFADPGKT